MNLKEKVLFGVFLIFFNLAAWQKDGSPIATGPGDQTNPRAVALDSNFVVIYKTPLQPMTDKLHAAKVNGRTGEVIWDVLVSEDTSLGYRAHQVVVDERGMIWVAFERVYTQQPNFLIGLQKLSPSGERLLGKDGINVSPGMENQIAPQLCLDGSGEGCYGTWTDYRSGNADVWAAGVTKDGQVAWTVPVCSLAEYKSTPEIVKSGNGCIIFWEDERTSPPGSGIYAQRIVQDSSAGQWGANGKLIIPFHYSTDLFLLDTDNSYFFPYAIGDGQGGAVVYNVFGYNYLWQRIDSLGHLLWNPPPSGMIPYQAVSNGAAGAIGCISSSSSLMFPYSSVYAVQMDSSGKSIWGGEIEVWKGPEDTASYSTSSSLIDDFHHGAVITWGESDYTGKYLLISRVDSSGKEIWSPPTIICNISYEKAHPFIIKGPNQGYIVIWEDARNGNYDLYAQYIDSAGQVGINETARSVPLSNEGLLSNEPNPFSRTISIKYEIASPDWVELTVFDVTGRKVQKLLKNKVTAGVHTTMWDGTDGSGKKVPSGIYFCRLRISRAKEKLIYVNKVIFMGKEDQ